jgi:Protein of unknown function (DUF1566)
LSFTPFQKKITCVILAFENRISFKTLNQLTQKYTLFFLGIFLVTIISCTTNDPTPGADGLISLVKITIENPGQNCSTGGTKIDTGIDENKNNTLDADEVQSTAYICNGSSGLNILIRITDEPTGTNCTNGGYKINSGLDLNKDGTLGDSEISQTVYLCNGNNGLNSLMNVTIEPAGSNCANGGYKIESGLDLNKDGLLNENEIVKTVYQCNSSGQYQIGQSYGGGIIFYLDNTQEHGLIAAASNLATAEWGPSNFVTNARGIAIGTGQSNTTTITAAQGTGNYGAKICDELTLNGYSDWFLPSRDELNELYLQKAKVGGFTNDFYWSSTENDEERVWGQLFSNGSQSSDLAKSNQLVIRPIRAF